VPSELPGRRALDDLDRRFLPPLAARLDRLVRSGARRMPGRPELAGRERRILAALAVVLLACAVALTVIGA
jgi:hypothetical protein